MASPHLMSIATAVRLDTVFVSDWPAEDTSKGWCFINQLGQTYGLGKKKNTSGALIPVHIPVPAQNVIKLW